MPNVTSTNGQIDDDQADVAVPLDSLLSSVGRVANPGLVPGREVLSWARALARRPRSTGARALGLAAELGRITAGTSDVAPAAKDRRFADDAWSSNVVLRRSVQAYLATAEKALQLVDDAELDEQTDQRLRLLVQNLIDALAPSNNIFLNPAAGKAVIDSGGTNLVRGAVNMVSELSRRPRIPTMVDTDSFDVGENLGCSDGSVVFRTPVFELIQYTPTTETVREVPLLVLPPTINKFYILDLTEGRSIVEHLVSSGQQVFMVSWRNPTAEHADWDLDTYVEAALEAFDAVKEIADVDRTAVLGACSGGIIASIAMSHLAATSRSDELAALTLLVTVLDQARAGTTSALVDRARADAAMAVSRRVGYLDGSALAEVFAWLRPNDLIWNYWVNNYLLGKKPPAFDVLYWNADTTRMPAALHRDFLEMGLGNTLVTPGSAMALGVPVDLGQITADAYVVGGIADHITPWQSCYRTTGLLGGTSQFILSNSGHIAALVNPPTNQKASFQTAADNPVSSREFASTAEKHESSWWPHYVEWLTARTGEEKAAPTDLGRGSMQPLVDAPGTYVFGT